MFRYLLICLLLLMSLELTAQQTEELHSGFYLSAGVGVSGGNAFIGGTNSQFKIYGYGSSLDLKAGVSAGHKNILHLCFIRMTMIEPEAEGYGSGSNDGIPLNFYEYMFGPGLTHYFKSNTFFSGTIGGGYFKVENIVSGAGGNSSLGISGQLKIGTDFWLKKELAIGLGISYVKMYLPDDGISTNLTFNSNRLSLLLNATFN
jgi:hypothetical protein